MQLTYNKTKKKMLIHFERGKLHDFKSICTTRNGENLSTYKKARTARYMVQDSLYHASPRSEAQRSIFVVSHYRFTE